jgi:aminoglycoside 3-N-acetyltransferase I
MRVEIKLIGVNDVDYFLELISVFKKVFYWDNFIFPNQTYLKKMLNNKNLLSFIAIENNKVVGGLTAYILDRYDSEKPSAYVYDLAVLPDFQRKGFGKQLIAVITEYCKENGFYDVFVQTERDDLQAVNFYRGTKISSEIQATHFTYSFYNNTDSNEK